MKSALRTMRQRWRDRGDAGLSLIECVVAIALLIIIILPTTIFIIEGQQAASEAHLEAEATTLADQALNGLQAQAARGALPAGFQSTAQSVDEVGGRKTLYTIATTWTPIQQGTNKTICAAGAGISVAQQIWLVTATVTWNGMGGAAPISDTTEIAPGTDGALQQSAGELAVTLDNGVGSNIFKGAAVTATMTGTWTYPGGEQPPAVPVGDYTTESRTSINTTNGKFDGCLIFQNLDAIPGWVYTLSFAGNGDITEAQEYSDDNPNGAYTVQNLTLQVGVPQIMTVFLNIGTQINIGYTQGPGGNCTAGGALTAPATTSQIPVTVNNTGLTTYTNDDWIASSANGLGGPALSTVYLYPSYSTLTSIWAGNGHNSAQVSPCTVSPGTGAAQTVYLQLYDLNLGVAGVGASCVPISNCMVATDQGIQYYLTAAVAGHSLTDLPLGQYTLTVGSGGPAVTYLVGVVPTPAEVWVTEGGNCLSSAATPPSPCNSPITGLTAP